MDQHHWPRRRHAASRARSRSQTRVLLRPQSAALSRNDFGGMSFLVVQRTHEMGVRMALGAQRSDVLRLVIGRAARLVLMGTAAGLLLGILSSRALQAMLFKVGAFDPTTFLGVTVALILV